MARPSSLPAAQFHVAIEQVHQAGGDFYDVIDLDGQQFDYVVADASGHDLSATYWTMALKTLLLEYSAPLLSPKSALDRINRALLKILPAGVFFTATYARLNRKDGLLSIANAAHPPAILVPAHHGEMRLIQQSSDVVGCFRDAMFSSTDLTVHPGDRVFLFSDGVVEGQGHRVGGIERLADTIGRHGQKSLKHQVELILADQLKARLSRDDALLMGIEV